LTTLEAGEEDAKFCRESRQGLDKQSFVGLV
jgi:hypothetical protein